METATYREDNSRGRTGVVLGKPAEQSAGRTEGRPSVGRGDGERVVTTAHADALVSHAEKTAERIAGSQ